MFIEKPKLRRFLTMENVVIGARQMAALKMVLKRGRMEGPPVGAITSTGELRDHNFSDSAALGLLDTKVDLKKARIIYLPNALTRKVVAKATVAELPPSGYKKVPRRGRPPANGNARRKVA